MSSSDALAKQVAARIAKKKESDREEAEQAAAVRAKKNNADDDEEVLEDGSEEEGGEEEAYEEEDVNMMEEQAEESKEPERKPKAKAKPSSSSHLDTEGDDEDERQWSTERDEAAEAEAHAEALNGSAKKKRRLTKLADADDRPSFNRHAQDDDDDGDFIVDDTGALDKDDDFGVKRDKQMMDEIEIQKPFQPAATPQEKGGRKRFLAYNSIGSISATEVDSALSAGVKVHTIEMIYSDSSKLKAAKFRDFFNFKVAALGPHGAVFASESDWDKQTKKEIPGTIFFRPSDTWDNQSSSEWQLQLDLQAKEEAVVVAIGDTWVAVGTNKQYVRIISHSGIQKFILSLNGPIVTMVGHGNFLACVYHDGLPLPGHQSLGLVVMEIGKKKEVYRGKCVISPRSRLNWIGYSDIGMLISMDSFGVIRALGRSWDFQWTPILDTNLLKKPGSTDTYWPVSLIDDKLMCVLLKGGSRYPSVQPRPSLQAVSMQLPFLDITNENRVAFAEENHARFDLLWFNDTDGGMATQSKFFTSKQETQQDKLILGLFQKACALDRHSRALDLCTMLHKKKAVEIAIQIATHQKKTALVSRITMLLNVKFPVNVRGNDDEGLSSFLEPTPAAAAASKRGTLRRPAVSFEDAEEENKRGNEDGEAEMDFGTNSSSSPSKSNLKRKYEEPSSTPLASLTSSLNVKSFTSVNVKPKAPAGTGTPASSQATNPFANRK